MFFFALRTEIIRCAAEITDQEKRRCWGEESVTSISIMARVPHDSPLLGSLVNFDESSASARTAPNYRDGGVGGLQLSNDRSITASFTCERCTRASRRRPRQIVIGIWVTSHQPPSALLLRIPHRTGRDGAEGCFKRPREVSGCHKRQILVDLNIKRREPFASLILKV